MKEIEFIINPELIIKGIKIHLIYYQIFNFDNTIKFYDYSESVINPETKKINQKYSIKNIKENYIISEYRKFYWKYLNIDPTKIRPSGEALVRRILQGKKLPKINYFVDGYNWASAVSLIPIGAYDADKVGKKIELRHAKKGEEFNTIGGKNRKLTGNELITIDENETFLSQFPYRDADKTKITEESKNLFITCLGIDGILRKELENSAKFVLKFLEKGISNKPISINHSRFKYISNF